MRRMARGRACGPWQVWLIFPLIFWVIPTLRRIEWPDLGAMAMKLSPLTPLAEMVARATSLNVGEAYMVVVAAIVLNGGALLYVLRNRRAG